MGMASFFSGMSVKQRCGWSKIELCIAPTARWKSLREKVSREGMKQWCGELGPVWVAAEDEIKGMGKQQSLKGSIVG